MSEPARIAVLGVTGFIGRGLPPAFAAAGMDVTGISRRPRPGEPGIAAWQTPQSLDLGGHLAVVNLGGEPIDRRWTERNRRLFHESRIGVTRTLVTALRALPPANRPKVLVNGSAVGYYGDRSDEELDERAGAGEGYLAGLCREWEDAACEAEALGVRVVRLRTGVVLGRDGAAFRKLRTVFKTGLGGRLGSGRQWMPWIHVDDLRAAIVHAVRSPTLSGPVNGCAPHPRRNAAFTRIFADAVHRPALLPVPGFALKLALGGFGGALLDSQHALPKALLADGFEFRFPTLESALTDLLR